MLHRYRDYDFEFPLHLLYIYIRQICYKPSIVYSMKDLKLFNIDKKLINPFLKIWVLRVQKNLLGGAHKKSARSFAQKVPPSYTKATVRPWTPVKLNFDLSFLCICSESRKLWNRKPTFRYKLWFLMNMWHNIVTIVQCKFLFTW